jgi:hypothetical protein
MTHTTTTARQIKKSGGFKRTIKWCSEQSRVFQDVFDLLVYELNTKGPLNFRKN